MSVRVNSYTKAKDNSAASGGSSLYRSYVKTFQEYVSLADKLSHTVNLWGHPFDGSNDVDGDFEGLGSWIFKAPYNEKSLARFIPGQTTDGLSRWVWRYCNVELHDGKFTLSDDHSTDKTVITKDGINAEKDFTIEAGDNLTLKANSMTQSYNEGHLDLGLKGDLKAGSLYTNNLYDYGTGSIYVGSPLLLDGGLDLNGDLTVKNMYSQNITNDQEIRTKNLTVTGQMTVFDLVIAEISAVGGMLILSAADFKIDDVEPGRTNVPNEHNFSVVGNGWIDGKYRTKYIYQICVDEDGQEIENKWKPFDQIISYTANVADGSSLSARNWWTLVLNVEHNVNHLINGQIKPCNRLEIVEAIAEPKYSTGGEVVTDNYWLNPSWGPCNPLPGDNCALLGSNNPDRQAAIILSAYNTIDLRLKAPCMAQYAGICGYELPEAVTYFSRTGNRISGNIVTNSGKDINDVIDSVIKGQQTYMHRAYADSEDGAVNFTKTKDREYAYEGLAANMSPSDEDLEYTDYIWTKAGIQDTLLPTRERLYLSDDDCLYLDVEYLTTNWSSGYNTIDVEIFTYGGAKTTRKVTDWTNDNKRLRYAGKVQSNWSSVENHAAQYCGATTYLRNESGGIIDSRSFQLVMDAGAIVSITDRINARVSDNEGNINSLVLTSKLLMERITSLDSSLQLALDDNSANLRIDAIDGRVNDIQITVNGLSASIQGITEYDDDWIRQRMAEYEVSLDGIRATLQSIATSGYDDTWIVKKFNDFQVTVDGLSETVSSIQTQGYDDSEIQEKISTLEHTVDGLKIDVQNIKTWGDDQETEEGELAVLANQIYARLTTNLQTTGIDITNGRIELDAAKTDVLGMLNIMEKYDSGISLYKDDTPVVNIVPKSIGGFGGSDPALAGRINRSDMKSSWSSWSGTTTPVGFGELTAGQTVAFQRMFVYMEAIEGSHMSQKITPPSGTMSVTLKFKQGTTEVFTKSWTLGDSNKSGTGWYTPQNFDFVATRAGNHTAEVTLTANTSDAVIADSRLRYGFSVEYEKNGQSGTVFGSDGIRIIKDMTHKVYAGSGNLYVQNSGDAYGFDSRGPVHGELQNINSYSSSGSFQTNANEYKMRWFCSDNFKPIFYIANNYNVMSGYPVYQYTYVPNIDQYRWCWQIDPLRDFGDGVIISGCTTTSGRQEPWVLLPPAKKKDSDGNYWHLPIGWRITIWNDIDPNGGDNGNVRVCVPEKLRSDAGKTFLDSNRNWNAYCCLDDDLGRCHDTYMFMGDHWVCFRDTQ